jgi:hypothetical protein
MEEAASWAPDIHWPQHYMQILHFKKDAHCSGDSNFSSSGENRDPSTSEPDWNRTGASGQQSNTDKHMAILKTRVKHIMTVLKTVVTEDETFTLVMNAAYCLVIPLLYLQQTLHISTPPVLLLL